MGLLQWLGLTKRLPEPTRSPAATAPTEADIRTALADTLSLASQSDLPAFVLSRVRRIAATIDKTLPRLANLGSGSYEGYSVVATATDYLPEALSGYLRLPREWADSRPLYGGKTALLLLIDQLDLLLATMDKILDAAIRTDAQALIVHGQFLKEKFGHSPASTPLPARSARAQDRGGADAQDRPSEANPFSLDLP